MPTYDYIVVGAGTAGCVIASRLSEDPAVSVLLIEAGGSDRTPMLIMPAALPFVYQSKRVQWGFRSGPEPELDGREIDEKSGRVMGGTSSINAMIFNRGNPLDYDGWAHDGLGVEWDYAHCLPYFKRMEMFADGPDEWLGGAGPMQVSRSEAKHRLYDALLESGEAVRLGVYQLRQRLPPGRHAHRPGVDPPRSALEHQPRLRPSRSPPVEPARPQQDPRRLSGLSGLVEQRVWTGLYDQNRLDGNAVIGNWPGHHDNVYVAAGFSGHGFMHALGVGRGLTEHLLTGDYQTVDLSRLGYARIEAEQPYAELGIR